MKRRQFLTLLGAASFPSVAWAQQQPKLIGFLCGKSRDGDADQVAAVWKGLNESGYFEGKNVAAEYRWAGNEYGRFPELAADLVAKRIDVLAAIGTTPAALAAKAQTKDVPVVFIVGTDPVAIGLVPNLNRPGGNLTGVTFLNRTLLEKQFEALQQIAPKATAFGLLVNPKNPFSEADVKEAAVAGQKLGIKVLVAKAGTKDELADALASLLRQHADGFVVAGDQFLNTQEDVLIAFAASHRMPAAYPWREATAAGGLVSYGASRAEAYQKAGTYVGRILKGEKPANLPVQQVTKVELVIDQRAANAIGVKFPMSLVGRADEVIE